MIVEPCFYRVTGNMPSLAGLGNNALSPQADARRAGAQEEITTTQSPETEPHLTLQPVCYALSPDGSTLAWPILPLFLCFLKDYFNCQN